ncbi:unnamed protein product, partial [Discosporangium mesarthrocarpum]
MYTRQYSTAAHTPKTAGGGLVLGFGFPLHCGVRIEACKHLSTWSMGPDSSLIFNHHNTSICLTLTLSVQYILFSHSLSIYIYVCTSKYIFSPSLSPSLQRPYCALRTLREQVMYPTSPADIPSFPDSALKEILDRVGLSGLPSRAIRRCSSHRREQEEMPTQGQEQGHMSQEGQGRDMREMGMRREQQAPEETIGQSAHLSAEIEGQGRLQEEGWNGKHPFRRRDGGEDHANANIVGGAGEEWGGAFGGASGIHEGLS